MFDPQENHDVLDPTDHSSTENKSTDMDASMGFSVQETSKIKKVKPLEELEGDVETPVSDFLQDKDTLKIKTCGYCGKGFHSDRALGGHLRIHGGGGGHHRPKPKSKSVKKNKKRAREHERPCEEEKKEYNDKFEFACFGCKESFVSLQLLCRHVRNSHRPSPNPNKGFKPIHISRPNSSSKETPDHQTTIEFQQEERGIKGLTKLSLQGLIRSRTRNRTLSVAMIC
ncbi:Zinc finger, C2H2-like protein [Corchorus olitorius]|uniref:Zinc finger, C2H2-like protein n=1 Tax=Corchorus olitorius TaxID=93759 RepID=A0A1R3J2V0_9ROSI|nr:Zinc finger, C2H2-like protein [Corchorus olitorius]